MPKKTDERPRKAVVLAAGLGERMRPLSLDLPKPAMPFWGRPLIGHTLDLLRKFGVQEVLVNLHHAPDKIVECCRNEASSCRVAVNFSYEPLLAGTGGALRRASWFLDDSPFWILNADIAADVEPEPFLGVLAGKRCVAAVWLTDAAGPRTVEMRGGVITNFISRSPGTKGTYTFCGLHLVSPRILDYLPQSGMSSIIDAYSLAVAEGYPVAGVCVPGSFWADLGTPGDYLEAHRETLERRNKGQPGGRLARMSGRTGDLSAVGPNVRVGKGARIAGSVVWDGSTVSARACARNAVIGRGVTVSGTVEGVVVRADILSDPPLRDVIRRLGWPLDRTTASPLPARGSARSFTRLINGTSSVILMRYGLERPENALFAAALKFLRRIGVPTPRMLRDFPASQTIVLEDLGYDSLLRAARNACGHSLERRYRATLDAIQALHRRGAGMARKTGLKLPPPFSRGMYRWERELFAVHFLKGLMRLRNAQIAPVMEDLAAVAERLLKEPLALIHRDLQSSNVLLKNGRPVFIDFQGMRLGAVSYDIASLLCDPYVSLSRETQMRLLDYYARSAGGKHGHVAGVFWHAAVQRLCQAIGAFARLGSRSGTFRFRTHIAPAFLMMDRALRELEASTPPTPVRRLRRLVQRVLEAGESYAPAPECRSADFV